MKNQPDSLNESLWRRKLSEAERTGLHAQPELELEATLTRVLTEIPDAPVPSNFAARVLDAVELVEQAERRKARSPGWTLNWRLFWPRVAAVAAVLIFVGLAVQRYETKSHRFTLAQDVVMVAVAQPLPSVDALENLDAIQRMSQSGHADGELLAALQ
jgi:hypothetical protein